MSGRPIVLQELEYTDQEIKVLTEKLLDACSSFNITLTSQQAQDCLMHLLYVSRSILTLISRVLPILMKRLFFIFLILLSLLGILIPPILPISIWALVLVSQVFHWLLLPGPRGRLLTLLERK